MGIAGHCNVYGLVSDRARLGATCQPRPRASSGASTSTDSDTPRADRVIARRAWHAWEERFDAIVYVCPQRHGWRYDNQPRLHQPQMPDRNRARAI